MKTSQISSLASSIHLVIAGASMMLGAFKVSAILTGVALVWAMLAIADKIGE